MAITQTEKDRRVTEAVKKRKDITERFGEASRKIEEFKKSKPKEEWEGKKRKVGGSWVYSQKPSEEFLKLKDRFETLGRQEKTWSQRVTQYSKMRTRADVRAETEDRRIKRRTARADIKEHEAKIVKRVEKGGPRETIKEAEAKGELISSYRKVGGKTYGTGVAKPRTERTLTSGQVARMKGLIPEKPALTTLREKAGLETIKSKAVKEPLLGAPRLEEFAELPFEKSRVGAESRTESYRAIREHEQKIARRIERGGLKESIAEAEAKGKLIEQYRKLGGRMFGTGVAKTKAKVGTKPETVDIARRIVEYNLKTRRYSDKPSIFRDDNTKKDLKLEREKLTVLISRRMPEVPIEQVLARPGVGMIPLTVSDVIGKIEAKKEVERKKVEAKKEAKLEVFQKRGEKLVEWERKAGERSAKVDEMVGKIPGLGLKVPEERKKTLKSRIMSFTDKEFASTVGRTIVGLPAQMLYALPEKIAVSGAKAAFAIKGLTIPEVREDVKAESWRAAKETPMEIVKSYDPTTPQGLVNIGVTALMVRSMGKTRAQRPLTPKKGTTRIDTTTKHVKGNKIYVKQKGHFINKKGDVVKFEVNSKLPKNGVGEGLYTMKYRSAQGKVIHTETGAMDYKMNVQQKMLHQSLSKTGKSIEGIERPIRGHYTYSSKLILKPKGKPGRIVEAGGDVIQTSKGFKIPTVARPTTHPAVHTGAFKQHLPTKAVKPIKVRTTGEIQRFFTRTKSPGKFPTVEKITRAVTKKVQGPKTTELMIKEYRAPISKPAIIARDVAVARVKGVQMAQKVGTMRAPFKKMLAHKKGEAGIQTGGTGAWHGQTDFAGRFKPITKKPSMVHTIKRASSTLHPRITMHPTPQIFSFGQPRPGLMIPPLTQPTERVIYEAVGRAKEEVVTKPSDLVTEKTVSEIETPSKPEVITEPKPDVIPQPIIKYIYVTGTGSSEDSDSGSVYVPTTFQPPPPPEFIPKPTIPITPLLPFYIPGGGLPKGYRRYRTGKGVAGWTVVNPIRDLPGEFFGKKMPQSINRVLGIAAKKRTAVGKFGVGVLSANKLKGLI